MKKLGLLAFFLSGCIVYDHGGKCHDCEDWDTGFGTDPQVGGNTDDTAGNTDTSTDTANEGDSRSFSLSPSQGNPGDTLIASLTADNGDTSSISNLHFYGEVTVLASENRGDEVLLTLSIPADASSGTADLLLEFEDGSAQMLDDIFQIGEGGAGTQGGDPNGGTDTGSGC